MTATDPKLKEKILDSIKKDGISVPSASREYGVSTVSIYSWLRKEVEGNGGNNAHLGEIRRLRKDKSDLLLIIGELTAELKLSKKKR